MATGTMEDYGAPVQTTSLSLSSMELLCFEMFPDVLDLYMLREKKSWMQLLCR